MQGVMVSNLQLLRETHLMDRDYFKLIVTLVKGSSEVCNHKIRRTGLVICLANHHVIMHCVNLVTSKVLPTSKLCGMGQLHAQSRHLVQICERCICMTNAEQPVP